MQTQTAPKKNRFPHMQPFNVHPKRSVKEKSWWNGYQTHTIEQKAKAKNDSSTSANLADNNTDRKSQVRKPRNKQRNRSGESE